MELPKIRNQDLPQELREIVGDGDAEFDLVVDPMDVMDIQFDPDSYYEGRHQVAQMLIESRKKLHNYHATQRHNQNSKENSKDSEETP
jgi:hypothetical protein|tara:strand:+ start:2881 stop:3144 length:264 start_codon:yes stop_codon:yes gene_type:complete